MGAWAPPDNGEGMDLDSVTDMAGAGDSARAGVGGLGLGQVSVREAGGPDEAMDCVSTLEDPVADARLPSTSLQAAAGQLRSDDELSRRKAKAAKHTAKRNARRKRD